MRFKKIFLPLILVVMSFALQAQNYSPDFIDGQIMFKLKDNVPIESADVISTIPLMRETNKAVSLNDFPQLKPVFAPYSVVKIERPSYYTRIPALMRVFRVHFSNYAEAENMIRDLEALDFIEYAEKMPIRKITLTPNDAQYGLSTNKWYFTLVNAEQAWNISLGSSNIKVAVVDNAVFCGHSDLTTYLQRDVADSDNDATPPEDANSDFAWSHGTHCAGLATADVNNGIGMASLGGNVELIGVKCTPNSGSSGSIYYGYDGVQWACQNGANVVSMSWGGGGFNNSEQLLINSYPGVVFLAAAGNDGVTTLQYPGAYANVICVGSVDGNDTRSSFSNYNGTTAWVDIASPGGYTNSGLLNCVYTAGGNNYGKMGGTSMATPFAAGLTGLMLSLNPSLSPSDILTCLINSGATINQNIGPRINAYAALQCVQATMTGDPYANFGANNTNITVGDAVTFTDLSNDGGNAITSWNWTFTGGTPSSFTGQNPPAVTYNTVGSYPVSLTVTNSQSSDTETKTGYITVSIAPYGGWIEQVTGFATQYRGINHISIVDQNVVWATAYDGSGGGANIQEFTKTTNGGTTWTPGTINVGNTGLGIAMIQGINSTTAWLAAFPNASGQIGGIWKTTNGGTTWTRQATAVFNNAASFTNVVHFWDANTGFCAGDPINSEFELYTTTNGGTTWTLVPGANIPAPLSGEYGYTRQIEVVGNVVWFTTNKGRIYRSPDKGLNWVVYQSPLTDFGGTSMSGNISFKDANTGLIVNVNNLVYKTTDGGANWTQLTTTGTVNNGGLCWVVGTDIVFSTGSGGSSFSQDGGLSWNPIDTDQHTVVEFSDQSTGWSGWFNESSTSKGIWKWQNSSSLIADFSGVPTVVCSGASVSFSDETTGGTPTTWSWSFPGGTPATSTSQNPVVVYNTPGTYDVTLTVDDGNGPATKTITSYITVNGAPAQPSVIAGINAPCPGTTQTYSVTSVFGVNYNWTLPLGWTGSSTTNSIDVTVGSGSGNVTVTPSNSCGNGTARSLAVSVPVTPVATFTYVNNQGTVTFTNTSSPNGTSWNWDFGDGGTANTENPVHIYTTIGTFDVYLLVSNVCTTDTFMVSVLVDVLSVPTSATDLMKVYPQPAGSFINVDLAINKTGYNWSMTDVHGRVVLTGTIESGNTGRRIDVSELARGYYTLNLKNENGSSNWKIILE